MSGVDVGRRCRATMSGVEILGGSRLLVSVSGTAWQLRTVSHDVHGLITAIATGNALFLLYLSEAEDVGVWSAGAKREERRSYLQHNEKRCILGTSVAAERGGARQYGNRGNVSLLRSVILE